MLVEGLPPCGTGHFISFDILAPSFFLGELDFPDLGGVSLRSACSGSHSGKAGAYCEMSAFGFRHTAAWSVWFTKWRGSGSFCFLASSTDPDGGQ